MNPQRRLLTKSAVNFYLFPVSRLWLCLSLSLARARVRSAPKRKARRNSFPANLPLSYTLLHVYYIHARLCIYSHTQRRGRTRKFTLALAAAGIRFFSCRELAAARPSLLGEKFPEDKIVGQECCALPRHTRAFARVQKRERARGRETRRRAVKKKRSGAPGR